MQNTIEKIDGNNDGLVEMERSHPNKKTYASPSLTEIGKINQKTRGKNVTGGDPGNWFES